MSLMLRKTCQEYLDAVGLAEYHVRVDDHHKNMQIVGPCGQPLFTISGIRFSRAAPAMSEIEYGAELLQEFLLTHKKDIEAFFKARITLQNTKVVESVGNMSLWSNYNKYFGSYTEQETKQCLTYSLAADQFKVTQENFSDISSLASLAKNKKIQKELKTAVEEYAVYQAALNEFNAAKQTAQTCNI